MSPVLILLLICGSIFIMNKKEFSYKIEYEADKETGQIIATIPELNHISSFGETFAEAEANIHEAALGYLEVLVRQKRAVPPPVFHTEGTYLKLFVPLSA